MVLLIIPLIAGTATEVERGFDLVHDRLQSDRGKLDWPGDSFAGFLLFIYIGYGRDLDYLSALTSHLYHSHTLHNLGEMTHPLRIFIMGIVWPWTTSGALVAVLLLLLSFSLQRM